MRFFELLRVDYELSTPTNLKYVGREYDSFFYNYAQYTCDKILESVEGREGIEGVLVDSIDAIASTPVVTNHGQADEKADRGVTAFEGEDRG